MISLIIADDHPLYLEGLEMLLNKTRRIKIEAKCSRGSEAISVLKNKDCDVLLLDLHMPDMSGLEAVEEIRKFKPEQKIIMLTHQKGSRYLSKLEKLGINGYVLKNVNKEELLEAIETVNEGKSYFTEGIHNISKEDDFYIKSSIIVNENEPNVLLTPREQEILIRVCNEMSSSEIAKELFISIGTVDTHRKNILQKLGISNTVGLVKFALKHNLIKPD
ncbi:MAG: DNA-binding response regulator [Bacteroidetes bacterium]|jgi:DNA-binding NarL/FixJ family response regulator|nr:DNA-binding response regulator [Bacteroidota bacterium]